MIDGRVMVRDAESLANVKVLDDLRGSNTCCLREHFDGPPSLCFSCKRQLLLVEYSQGSYRTVKVFCVMHVR